MARPSWGGSIAGGTKGRFRRWLTEGKRARTEAALIAQHGKFLMAYTQELHREVVPANGKAVAEICTAAVDVVHNQQLRRRAASAFQKIGEEAVEAQCQ